MEQTSMKESILWPILQQARNHSINGTNFDVDKFYNKFAELVVRECIQVGGPEDSYTDEWFKAKADSVGKIKQHFGVDNK
jgi:hypothetical protein